MSLKYPMYLSPRERQVYRLICGEGLTNPEIAQRIGITAETVKTHTSKILLKRMVKSRVELVVKHYTEARAA
jgi:DNA-binding NarL/FixJ family response regulator